MYLFFSTYIFPKIKIIAWRFALDYYFHFKLFVELHWNCVWQSLGNLAPCLHLECINEISDLFPVFMKYTLQEKVTEEPQIFLEEF